MYMCIYIYIYIHIRYLLGDLELLPGFDELYSHARSLGLKARESVFSPQRLYGDRVQGVKEKLYFGCAR